MDSITSDLPEDKKDRVGQYLHAEPGMNVFWWSMQYPPGEKMVDTDYHERPAGPLALPGRYRAELRVGDWSMSQEFELVKDPRVRVSQRSLTAQFKLLTAIQDKLNQVVVAVNRIRSMKKQLADWNDRLATDEAVVASAAEVSEQLDAVERELVQRELTSFGDGLNYREMLFEKLAGLPPIVASADTKPTEQSVAVFDKLSAQIDEQLEALDAIVEGDLAALNAHLAGLDVAIVDA